MGASVSYGNVCFVGREQFISNVTIFMPPLRRGAFRFALVRPSIRPQLHKWGHLCPMDTFLVSCRDIKLVTDSKGIIFYYWLVIQESWLGGPSTWDMTKNCVEISINPQTNKQNWSKALHMLNKKWLILIVK